MIGSLIKKLGWDEHPADGNAEAERWKKAVLPLFAYKRELPEKSAAFLAVRSKLAIDHHDAVVRLKALAEQGGVLCNAAGYLEVKRNGGSYSFHYRVPNDGERERVKSDLHLGE